MAANGDDDTGFFVRYIQTNYNMSKVERVIKVKLTGADLEALHRENAEIDLQIKQAEEQLDEAKKQFKFAVEPLKTRKQLLILNMRVGFIERNVETDSTINLITGNVEFRDPDTGILLDTRPLTPKEAENLRRPNLFEN